MPRSQIKSGKNDFFKLRRFLDIIRAPCDVKTFCSRIQKSNGHRTAVSSEMPCVHFSNQKDTGRRTPVGHRAAVRLPYSHRAVAVQFMLSFAFNHSFKLRILNNASRGERENSTNWVAVSVPSSL